MEQDKYVVIAECLHEIDKQYGKEIVFESYSEELSLERAKKRLKSFSNNYRNLRLAKLTIIE